MVFLRLPPPEAEPHGLVGDGTVSEEISRAARIPRVRAPAVAVRSALVAPFASPSTPRVQKVLLAGAIRAACDDDGDGGRCCSGASVSRSSRPRCSASSRDRARPAPAPVAPARPCLRGPSSACPGCSARPLHRPVYHRSARHGSASADSVVVTALAGCWGAAAACCLWGAAAKAGVGRRGCTRRRFGCAGAAWSCVRRCRCAGQLPGIERRQPRTQSHTWWRPEISRGALSLSSAERVVRLQRAATMEQGRRRYGGGGVASAAAAVDSGDGRSRAGSSTQPVTVLRLDEIPLLADVPPAKKRILAQAFGAHHHRVRHLIRVVSLSSRGLGGARGAVTRSYEPGEVLIQQGDTGDMFFILQSGTVSVLQHDAATGVEQLLATLEPPGASFGELALIKVRN